MFRLLLLDDTMLKDSFHAEMYCTLISTCMMGHVGPAEMKGNGDFESYPEKKRKRPKRRACYSRPQYALLTKRSS